MSFTVEKFCRLCLKAVKNEFKEISENINRMLYILLFKMDLDRTRDPIVCLDCIETAKNCLNFKCAYIDTEEIILLYSIGRKDAKHDINVIYNDTQHVGTVVNGDLDICRFCMTPLVKNKFASLDGLMKETVFQVLSAYMPEVDFNIIENPFICTTCRESVEGYFKFVQKCMCIEEKIKTYYEKEVADSVDKINLSNVTHFLFKDMLKYTDKCSQIHATKEDSNTCDNTGCTYSGATSGLTKCEEFNLKEEGINSNEVLYKNLLEIMFDRYSKTFPSKEYDKETVSDQKILEQKEKYDFDRKIYKCSLCAFEVRRKDHLSRHILMHKDISEKSIYQCSLCSFITKRIYALRLHSRLVHKDVSVTKMFECPSNHTDKKNTLKNQVIVHKDVATTKTYKCSLCAFEATHKNNLRCHLLVHKDVSETKMFKCSLCPYEAKIKTYLKKHIRAVHKYVRW